MFRPALLALLVVGISAADVATLAGPDLDRRYADQRAALLQRERDDLLSPWETKGQHGAWDDQVREALGLYARQCAGQAPSGTDARIVDLLHAAQAAGCHDPLVGYLLLRSQGAKVPAQAWIALAKPMADTGYAAAIRFSLARRSIDAVIRQGGAGDPRLDDLWKSLPALAAPLFAGGTGATDVHVALVAADVLWSLPGKPEMATLERQRDALLAACALAKANEWWRQHLLGEWHISAAWCARGSGWANTVTPAGWAGFRTHLKMARACLTRAWQLDPGNGLSAAAMITVCMGDDSDAESRVWFERAIAADPFRDRSYSSLGQQLMPRWGGSIGALLDLAGECVATRAWATPIPRCAIGMMQKAQSDSTEQPQALWGDARAWHCLDQLTAGERARPGADAASSDGERMVYAWRCGQRAEALRLQQQKTDPASVGWALRWTGGTREQMLADLSAWAAPPF